MANRLSKIYTRTGDDGSTGMADGSRVPKDVLVIQAIGEVDELNSQLGVLACHVPEEFIAAVRTIQNELFNVGAELSMGVAIIDQQRVAWLEESLDELNQSLPPLKEFILPGGSLAAAHCHVARAVCRRVERVLVSLGMQTGKQTGKQAGLNVHLKAYINRLSDYLFVLARAVGRQQGADEIYWTSEKNKS